MEMLKLLLNLCILTLIVCSAQDTPEVTIGQGTLKGGFRKSWKGRQIKAFTGIPYAKPPIGPLRFEVAQPAEPWNGVFDASKSHALCPQRFGSEIVGSEDCLYLSVYVPELKDTKERLPVMVFIHGGSLEFGSANPSAWGPDILLDQDIILVTMNYRLGALGFLSMVDSVLPGNNGLKDQNLALKWVKNNIAAFGGNPTKVTISGQSSGGVCAHHHVLSPASRGLFSAAILQSGVATLVADSGSRSLAVRNAKRLGQFLNCSTGSSQELVDCLRQLKAEDIIAQKEKFYEWNGTPIVPFKIVAEPNIEGAFITENPVDTIKSGKVAQVPIMTGITTEDGGVEAPRFFIDPKRTEELNRDFNKYAPFIFQYDEQITDRDCVSQKIRKFYFGDRAIDNSTKPEATNMMTDAWFMVPQGFVGELHAKYSNQPVFQYLFGFHGSVSFGAFFGDPTYDYGVVHCDDLIYLLSSDLFPNYKPNAVEQRMNDIMTTLLANFAKTGNPTPETNELIPNKWEPIQSGRTKYYFIRSDRNISMIDDPFIKRKNFWIHLDIDPFLRKGL